jgi:phosphatidate cytidylyltransferase
MSNFWQRAITGTIFVVVLVGAILLGGWYMHITFGLVVFFGLLEFYKLFERTETKPQKWVGTITGTLFYFTGVFKLYKSVLYRGDLPVLIGIAFVFLSLVMISIIELFRAKSKPFENIAITITGIFYIAVPFLLINLMTIDKYGLFLSFNFWPVLSVFILIWCNDTFAYLTGRLIGRHKLFERISPKKTWEGFLGGVVFAMSAGIFLAYLQDESYVKFVVYALIASVIGTLGDLVQSMLKRSVDVKDSGTILPGHGGILDRFDAVLFVVPVIFFLENFVFKALD